jgi:hypothetical protein
MTLGQLEARMNDGSLGSMPGDKPHNGAAPSPVRPLKFLRGVRVQMIIVLLIGAGLGWIIRGARLQRDAVAAIREAGGQVSYDWYWKKSTDMVPYNRRVAPDWVIDHVGIDYVANIEHINLVPTRLSDPIIANDATLAHLSRFGRLQFLSLSGTKVTDAGLEHLEGLNTLRTLELCNTAIGDNGLTHLRRLIGLQQLRLTGSRITDAGLVHLKGLSRLSSLDLGDTGISDAGLAHLKDMTNLGTLSLYGTKVTDKGVSNLKAALPGVQIYRNLEITPSGMRFVRP